MSDFFGTPWTVFCQAPLSMGFSRQEYWSGLPFLFPGDFPDAGIKPAWQILYLLSSLILSIFLCAFWPSVCLLQRNVYLDLLPIFSLFFFFFILRCMSYLYILEINPLSVALFANVFSHFVGCLFFFFYGFLCLAKPFKFE